MSDQTNDPADRRKEDEAREEIGSTTRRDLLKIGSPAVAASALAGPAVFALLFAKRPQMLYVEDGYYDPGSQLYISKRTGKPAYVNTGGARLELADTTGTRSSIGTLTGGGHDTDHKSMQDDFDN